MIPNSDGGADRSPVVARATGLPGADDHHRRAGRSVRRPLQPRDRRSRAEACSVLRRRRRACLLVPPLVSIVTGILLARFFPGVRGSGVPQTEAAFQLNGGVIPGWRAVGQVPHRRAVHRRRGIRWGAKGRRSRSARAWRRRSDSGCGLSPARIKELVPVGAAAALSAAFNTPVAAVIFTLEEIIGDMNAPLLGSTVLASVASVIVERSILGNEPLFHVPAYHLVHPAELVAYAVLGVLGGLVSLVFCGGLLGLRAFVSRACRSGPDGSSRRSAALSSASC